LSLVPCVGWVVGLPLGGVGLVLGIAGAVVALVGKHRGFWLYLCGSALSVLAVLAGLSMKGAADEALGGNSLLWGLAALAGLLVLWACPLNTRCAICSVQLRKSYVCWVQWRRQKVCGNCKRALERRASQAAMRRLR
jgi:hypothetical protein